MDRRAVVRRIFLWLAVLAVLVAYIWWGNATIRITQIDLSAPGLPEAFSGYRIAHISDLHNEEFGKDNVRLLKKLAECQPDAIFLTGDMIDSYHTNVDVSIAFVRQCAQIAPTYYVTGNHEHRVMEEYEKLRAAMEGCAVQVLENELVTLERGGAELSLIGLHDPNFTSVQDQLTTLAPQAEGFTILLAHHPELIGYYAGAGIDLVFSGHAHGGQFRFPILGGLVAPGQGWFPEYDAGLYQVQNTRMVVSRGLGNSAFPFRLNNRPEIVLTILH